MNPQEWIALATGSGAGSAAVMPVSKLSFYPEFREACQTGHCGFYEKCWMCPPDIGPIQTLISQAQSFQQVLVFQTIGLLDDPFDIEGMEKAAAEHNQVVVSLAEKATQDAGESLLILGAGACHLCGTCARADNAPCRFPGKAISSLEAYGIAVSQMAQACGLPYNNGPNTVTYFGAVLYGAKEGP